MAGTPEWKVYDPQGDYVAACKHIEDAACLISLYGERATIRLSHGRALWVEGKESQPAEDGYDFVAQTVLARLRERRAA